MKNNKRGNVTLVIGQVPYGQLEQEARKRALSPGDYLEMLIEMDQISNKGSDPGDVVSVSISERHYSLLSREAEAAGRGADQSAEMIIGLSAEMFPERPLSREQFDAVVKAWGGVKFPTEKKTGKKQEGAQKRGNSLDNKKASS